MPPDLVVWERGGAQRKGTKPPRSPRPTRADRPDRNAGRGARAPGSTPPETRSGGEARKRSGGEARKRSGRAFGGRGENVRGSCLTNLGATSGERRARLVPRIVRCGLAPQPVVGHPSCTPACDNRLDIASPYGSATYDQIQSRSSSPVGCSPHEEEVFGASRTEETKPRSKVCLGSDFQPPRIIATDDDVVPRPGVF
jgi:hypothetical protein